MSCLFNWSRSYIKRNARRRYREIPWRFSRNNDKVDLGKIYRRCRSHARHHFTAFNCFPTSRPRAQITIHDQHYQQDHRSRCQASYPPAQTQVKLQLPAANETKHGRRHRNKSKQPDKPNRKQVNKKRARPSMKHCKRTKVTIPFLRLAFNRHTPLTSQGDEPRNRTPLKNPFVCATSFVLSMKTKLNSSTRY